MCRRPAVVGGLAAAGIILFSGSCYAAALTEDKANGRLAPYGCALLRDTSDNRCCCVKHTQAEMTVYGAETSRLASQGHEPDRCMVGAGPVMPPPQR